MRVRQEQREVERPTLEFGEKRLTELAQAGAGVEDDDVTATADFHAGGVAAVAHGGRPRRGNGSANPPEFDVRAGLDVSNLMQTRKKTILKNPTGGKGGGRGAFSGLRTSEIERLDWQDVKFDTGCVVVQKGKVRTKRGRARRIVPMMPNLKAWLKPLAKESGPVSSTSISPANGVASATAR